MNTNFSWYYNFHWVAVRHSVALCVGNLVRVLNGLLVTLLLNMFFTFWLAGVMRASIIRSVGGICIALVIVMSLVLFITVSNLMAHH